jgi:predicted dehydrogenase
MVDNKLKTAILGLNKHGLILLEAANISDYYEIIAVADKNTQLVEKYGKKYNCIAYDDYRQLIIQHDLDCLFVGAALYSCIDYLYQAIKKRFNILKWPPVARNFEEAAELVKLAEDKGIQFSIANINRFSSSFADFREYIKSGNIEHIYLLELICKTGGELSPAWQDDQELSGGGVLLRNCYELVDQVVLNFSMPQEVYCVKTNTANDRKQRHYLTEDTAIVILKFREDFIGQIKTSKVFGPKEIFLRVFGKDKIIIFSDESIAITDNTGKVLEEKKYVFDEKNFMHKLLERYALSILKPDKNKPYSSAREHLKNMAIIESAYLSAKTGMPESVERIFEIGQVESVSI